MNDIGKTIRHIREGKGMTQDDLAEKLFVTRQTISSYETGRTKPDIEMLVKLSSAFDIDIHDMIYGPPDFHIHSRMKQRFFFAAIISVLMLIGNCVLSNWAAHVQTFQYNIIPKFGVCVLYKPLMYGLLGWTVIQGIGTFGKLRPLKENTARNVKIGILLLITAYLVLVFPVIASAMIGFSLPVQWNHVALFILGAHPTQPHSEIYLIVSFLIGAFLWLSGIFSKSHNNTLQ